MAMLAAFRSKHELTFNFHDKAVLAGSISRALAPRFGVMDKSQAFLCGLLTEIGAMACAAVDSEEYLRLWRAAAEDPAARSAAEVERYGATSEKVGVNSFAGTRFRKPSRLPSNRIRWRPTRRRWYGSPVSRAARPPSSCRRPRRTSLSRWARSWTH
jgi:hypothetical protein